MVVRKGALWASLFHFTVLIAVIVSLAAEAQVDGFFEGRRLYEQGKHAEAAVVLRHVVEQNPRDPMPWLYLGYCYQAGGKKDYARFCYERVLTMARNTPLGMDAQAALDNLRKASPDPPPRGPVARDPRVVAPTAQASSPTPLPPIPLPSPASAPSQPVVPLVPDYLPVRTYQSTGPPEKRFCIVFLGDGYLEADFQEGGTFDRDVRQFSQYLFGEVPFTLLEQRINIYGVVLASRKTQIGRQPGSSDTAFGVGWRGTVLTVGNPDKVAAAALKAPRADVACILVKAPGGGVARPSHEAANGQRIGIACFGSQGDMCFQTGLHELGHAIGKLDDEYALDDPAYDMSEDAAATAQRQMASHPLPSEGDIDGPNVTLARGIDPKDRATWGKLKWAHFLEYPGLARYIGMYEGGYYRSRGVYRPSPNCKMRHGGAFCEVCQEAIMRAVYERCGEPFDDAEFHRWQSRAN